MRKLVYLIAGSCLFAGCDANYETVKDRDTTRGLNSRGFSPKMEFEFEIKEKKKQESHEGEPRYWRKLIMKYASADSPLANLF